MPTKQDSGLFFSKFPTITSLLYGSPPGHYLDLRKATHRFIFASWPLESSLSTADQGERRLLVQDVVVVVVVVVIVDCLRGFYFPSNYSDGVRHSQ